MIHLSITSLTNDKNDNKFNDNDNDDGNDDCGEYDLVNNEGYDNHVQIISKMDTNYLTTPEHFIYQL